VHIAPAPPALSPTDVAAVQKRKDVLDAAIAAATVKLKALEKPLTGSLAESLHRAEHERRTLQQQINETTKEIESASLRLAVWYGRKTKFASSDPVNLAGEVAVSSVPVKEAKDRFEQATWEYLKQVEAHRYNPGDRELERRVGQLMQQRNDALNELSDATRRAIDEAVAEADRTVGALSLKKDQLNEELRVITREAQFAHVLLSGTPEEKAHFKEELVREKRIAEAERSTLDTLLSTGSQ
jgi:hypothetical protein